MYKKIQSERESEDKLWPLLPLLIYYQACQCLHTSCVLATLFFYISVMSILLSDVQGSIPTVKGRSYILFLFYSISDPALQELLKTLSTIALQDRASSTVKTYLRAFCRWSRSMGKIASIDPLPNRSTHIALYIVFLLQTARPTSYINRSPKQIL